jgi:hypothetical protein
MAGSANDADFSLTRAKAYAKGCLGASEWTTRISVIQSLIFESYGIKGSGLVIRYGTAIADCLPLRNSGQQATHVDRLI